MRKLSRLVILTFLCMLPLVVVGANYDFMVDGLCYVVNSNGTSVSVTSENTVGARYSNLSGDVVIPPTVTYQGTTYDVTAIKQSAFMLCRGITSVSIANSVTSIASHVFSGSGLSSISLPNSITTISSSLFYGCTRLTSIEIPFSVKSIGSNAFMSSGLTSIVIPNSVTTFGHRIFCDCSSLERVVLPDQIKSVTYGMFNQCKSLNTINLPESIESIDELAFSECSSLTSINIPNNVTTIKDNAFYKCTSLTSLTLPSNLLTIGNEAFYFCVGIQSVVIPDSIEEIGDKAFFCCSNLAEIEFPDKVFTLGDNVFSGTAWLANQPDGMIYVGLMAIQFKGSMPEGSTVTIKPGTQFIAPNCFSNCSWMAAVEIPESVTAIGRFAFIGCTGLSSISLPEFISQIEMGTFSGCSGLTSINIPNSVTFIGNEAFSGCSDMVNVRFSNSLTHIGSWAFQDCTHLETVELPESVTELGLCVFENCTGLATVILPSSLETIEEATFEGCTGLTTVLLPKQIKYLDRYAFYGCNNLIKLDIPNTLESIGDYAFTNCSHLTSIKLPAGFKNLGFGVFQGCDAIQEVMSLALTPPTAHEDESGYEGQFSVVYPGTFNGIDKENCVLRVFESAMTDYGKAKGWRQFTHREPINESEYVPGDVNGDGVVDIADVNGIINDMLGKAAVVVEVGDTKLGLALVEGGTFEMGLDDVINFEDYYDWPPAPRHQVTLGSYLISTTEVTQKLFHAVMGGTEPEYEQMNCPIYGINLNHVNSFIQRLNNVTGLQFRLPTEAEWEYAARGGNKSQGYHYSGSNVAYEVGWCTYSPWGPSSENDPRPVGKLKPNELGIYDMSGNVWEWCQDWFADYTEEAQVNPTGPETGTKRVIRGGSCYNDGDERHCDVYNRAGVEPIKTVFGINNEPIGIRLAMDLDETLYNRASDINNDGVVDISDVNTVINIMLGKDYDVPTGHQGHDTAPEKETIPQ